MDPEDFVLAIISAVPDRQIRGKKKLQKLAFLLVAAGAKCRAHFGIRDFGPFSPEIAKAAQLLSLKGRIIETEEPIGASKTFVTVYRIPLTVGGHIRQLSDKYRRLLRELDRFPTVDLEVAATFHFFLSAGLGAEAARRKTVELKPVKASGPVLRSMGRISGALRLG